MSYHSIEKVLVIRKKFTARWLHRRAQIFSFDTLADAGYECLERDERNSP